ncbi:hypothetical protein [Streptacidiphilus melanogenes]|uniref:hypothetical protein n=1 Tax=Streptacidiphilus melanogenes TaxID=411235 RepID=UPI00126A36F0|nr:hypothetical protein [Streptacidiphilus melanogenes]
MTFRERLRPETVEAVWLYVVLGVPFAALGIKHGYGESLRDGDFFLFGISALVATLFEWFVEQPMSVSRFFAGGSSGEALVILFFLGWNFYLFADLPGDHSSWHLNVALWLTVAFVVGSHSRTARQAAARIRRLATRS